MKKTPKSFKLSQAALDNLAFIVATTGVNQTAAVEMALAEKAISLRWKKPAPKKEPAMYSYSNQNRMVPEGILYDTPLSDPA